jgi:hypothetical protein
MAVTLRSGLNRQLTHAEMDANFTTLKKVSEGVNPLTDPRFGATGDGVANDTSAVTAAEADSPYFVPAGSYSTTINQGSLRGRWWGDGAILDSAGNKRGRWFSAIAAAPASLGTHTSILTAFNGDTSKVQLLMEHRITGSATVGQPTSGYLYTPEAYPIYGYLFNQSGYNHSTSGNDGRTGIAFMRLKVANNGQGDVTAYNASAFVDQVKVGATSFLANPAAGLFGGDIQAGADGVYLNPYEIAMNDQGYDVAGIGHVINMTRTNNTGALSVAWNGIRIQSIGSVAIDSGFFLGGSAQVGLDLSHATLDSAIALKAEQKIHFNVTADAGTFKRYPTLNNNYISYGTGAGGIITVVGGNSTLQVTSNQVSVVGTQGLYIASTGCLRVAGSSQATTGTSTASMTNPTNKPGSTTGSGAGRWLKLIDASDSTTWYIPMWAA